MTFAELQLSDAVLRAVADAGYVKPTPIQEQAIPIVLMGRDILGCAQTGTGKTASFTLPMIDILAAGRAKARMPRSLILEPTRELAAQVAENFDIYGKHNKLSKALIIGGRSMADQIKVLERGVDVLIATPGRLLDVFDRGRLLLNDVRILVIDEADRMLDMGFIPDVERIVSLVSRMRQTLLFSATMPPAIRRLADAFLLNPKEITVAPPSTPAATVTQGLVVVSHGGMGGLKEKRAALRRLIENEDVRNALIFCNRKRDVGVVHRSLIRHGYDAGLLHGDLAQSQRTEVLDRFKAGDLRLLVCSDVAARGLDINDMSHVFNFDVPTSPEDYVHRIGRTGRAGRSGRAYTIAVPEDGKYVALIEKLIGRAIPPLTLEGIASAELEVDERRGRRRRSPAKDTGRGTGRSTAATAAGGRSPRRQGTRTAPEHRDEAHRDERRSQASQTPSGKRAAAGDQRAQSEAAERKRAATTRPPAGQGKPQRVPRSQRDHEPPVVGLGDHVPAFLLREVPIRKKA
ncbi:MAG: DEAD/DEAH box helicase [Defluviicoccus sp.]|nr:MAG: DEAD/DEAH box helicase [Defluviicoccus sp.]